MNYVPQSGTVRAAAAEVFKKLRRPESSGYDEAFIDAIAEDYEYLVMPDDEMWKRKEVDRNLDKMKNAADSLLHALRCSRDDGVTDAFHLVVMDHPLDRQRVTMADLERWVERLKLIAEKCRLDQGTSGRRSADRPTTIAMKLADHFALLTGAEPTLSKKPGYDYCACVARLFAVLRISSSAEAYATKAINHRKLGNLLTD